MRDGMGMEKEVQAKQSTWVLLRSRGDAYLTPDDDAGRLNSILLKCNS